ncbi:HNH endonuclease [Nocardioides piscis]|uniref:HNH endonuclease n=1 Tax=Nocardioides piscis TaxID=2714938 RepID=UPI0019802FA5|nr:HNH endonuclease domain-containing protein [Nocardioides piscis]
MEFYSSHPTPTTAWRLAVLMGANSRTYKFALGQALLEQARAGRAEVTLPELARPYALALATRAVAMPQAPASGELGQRDFLYIARQESEATLRDGHPTERLIDAATRTMPGMVMEKFHNLAGGTQLPTRFYEIRGRGPRRKVILTPAMLGLVGGDDGPALDGELEARWRIVESSFAAGVGRSLITEGVAVDLASGTVIDKLRRRSLAGVREALGGFQHNRCQICDELLAPDTAVAVDHVFPFSLMSRGVPLGWADLDLDSIWNLAPAHATCNGAKSNRPPTPEEVARLGQRNAAIMRSPHPLKRTLELTLQARGYAGRPYDWPLFLKHVLAA